MSIYILVERNVNESNDSLRQLNTIFIHTNPCMKHLFVVGGRARTYLDSERNRCTGDMSPPSDNVIFDNQCYATTPSSSNGNSDMEQPTHCNSRRCNGSQVYQQQNMQSVSTPGSPTSRLLLEYEMHLRNTLAKGMDAESYSLRTFEALLTQSMEDLGEFNIRQIFFLFFFPFFFPFLFLSAINAIRICCRIREKYTVEHSTYTSRFTKA